ncbi:MAG: phosphoribosylformylglycinamidine synthase subunit PurS, partial [Actinomycetota bacterium]
SNRYREAYERITGLDFTDCPASSDAVGTIDAMTFDVLVEVRLREGIADPAGTTVERSLPTLGFDGIAGVRMGKAIRFTVDADDEATARSRVEELCERFLTNPVIEDSVIEIAAAA